MTPNPYPFMNVPSAPARPPTRVQMGVEICTVCDLAVAYCKCASRLAPDTQEQQAEVDLVRRARECAVGR
jgi:hypothetical protein